MNRDQSILSIIEVLGGITREFNVRGNYPFKQQALGRPHIDILFLLSEKSPLSIKELSQKLNVTSGAVTQFVDDLAAKQLVDKRDNPVDRRGRLIYLTDAASQESSKFKTEYIQTVGKVFRTLDDSEIRQLETLLAKVKR